MKQISLLLFAIVFPLLFFAQTIEFSTATKMELEDIGLEKVAKTRSGYYAAANGNKYLVLRGTLYTKARRRIELPIHQLRLKTNDTIYMAIADVSYVPFSELDRFIRFKKKSKRKIYFEVDENFKEGTLTYKQQILGTLMMTDGISAKFSARQNKN